MLTRVLWRALRRVRSRGGTFASGLLSVAVTMGFLPRVGESILLESAVLNPAQPVSTGQFGSALAAEGDTVVVGAPLRQNGRGLVLVYQRSGSGWGTVDLVARLSPSDPGSGPAFFGSSVAMEGDTIVVGAPGWTPSSDPSSRSNGAVFVYQKPPGGWQDMTETARLTSPEPPRGDLFGHAVAISGEAIVVAAPLQDHGEPEADKDYGAVYVFVRSGSAWTTSSLPAAKLVASDPYKNAQFGKALAISAGTLVVGAPLRYVASEGLVYVFEKPDSGWSNGTEVARLRPFERHAFEGFGASVAIEGNTVLVGAPQRHDYSSRPTRGMVGGAFVFERPVGGWSGELTETAFLKVWDGRDLDLAGTAVAFWGNRVLLGIPGFGDPSTCCFGAIAVFERPTSGWFGVLHEVAKITPSDPAGGERFGAPVAVTGSAVVGGAPGREAAGLPLVGRALVFEDKVLCSATPRSGCKSVTVGKGTPTLVLSKSAVGIQRDRIAFRWFPGEATDFSEFGDPASRAFALCVYDEQSAGFNLVASATAPPGGICRNRPCWRQNRSRTKWLYRDRDLTPDGLLRLDLVAGASGKARIVALAKGSLARVPALPLQQNTRVVAQVVSDTGACWSAEFTAPAQVNTDRRFRDKD